ncbi:MAG TPA: protein kinase [Candidatus Limnocylindria bacterium]|jgi:uncharacterized RDD family membrane protein YckC|nr:protein kinase [Candidatus Limnocylindria bacterium]
MKTIHVEPFMPEDGAPENSPIMGGYRIIRQLGQGGMGTVFEAEELEGGRRVALKVLSHGFHSPVAKQRFQREGLLAASINHPNTVYVFGTEEINGQSVIAMELAEGGTLQERVKQKGPMDVAEAVSTILQVIEGLEAAAALGVLHRDIKPSNCFMETDGTVKVGDFGLSVPSEALDDAKLTITGSYLGTPAYSPPEQIRGEAYTLRGDIYAVGVTLYYLVTGRTPFDGLDLVRTLAAVLERPPESPARIRPELPSELCGTILRCLEKQPSKRFRNYAALRTALLPFSSTTSTPAPLRLRFLAGCVDWLLLTAASIAVILLSPGHWDALIHPDSYPGNRLPVTVLGLVISLLYYTVLEGLWGASIGKRICGLGVTGPRRGSPGGLRALLRASLFDALPRLPLLLSLVFSTRARGLGGFDPAILILALLFCTARRKNGFAAVHDLWTGTRVLRRSNHQSRPKLTLPASHPVSGEVAQHLGPYQVLKTLHQAGAAELLLGFDPRLQRHIWIRKLATGTPPVLPSLRNLARVGRLRWINGRRSSEECWDAYEAGLGEPLLELAQRRQPWNRVRYWLLDLAEELTAAAQDRTLPAKLSLDHVWITSRGVAKILDFPAPLKSSTRFPSSEQMAPNPELFLQRVAVIALEGPAIIAKTTRPAPISAPLPPHAREVLKELEAGLSATQFAARLKSLLPKLAFASPRRRLAAILGSLTIPAVITAFLIAFVTLVTTMWQGQPEGVRLLLCLNRLKNPIHSHASAGGQEKDLKDHEAFEVYVAGHFRPMITNPATWTSLAGATLLRSQRHAAEQLIAKRPAPTESELQQASEVVEPFLKDNGPFEWFNPRHELDPKLAIYSVAWTVVLGSTLPSVFAALFFGGGPVLRTMGLAIVKKNGGTASRLRILWRSVIAWSPLLLLAVLGTKLVSDMETLTWQKAGLIGLGLIPVLGVVLGAALLPERGLHDRLAGTCLIPRE